MYSSHSYTDGAPSKYVRTNILKCAGGKQVRLPISPNNEPYWSKVKQPEEVYQQ